MSKLSKQAAQDAGNTLDKAADLVTELSKLAGVKPEVAAKFAMQCDLFSDHFAKVAGIDIAKLAAERKLADEDPSQIGEEKSGPKEQEGDESYMSGEFTQQENRELRERQEKGELGPGVTTTEPQSPTPGVQASLETGSKLASLYMDINTAATRFASVENDAVKGLGTRLAAAGLNVLQFQARAMEGSESPERVAALVAAAGHMLPHVASEVSPEAAAKLAAMADILSGVAKAA